MYSVGLNNKSCLFDYANGFSSAKEAMEWALGRGGHYVAQIYNDDQGYGRSFSIDSHNRISTYLVDHWTYISLNDVDSWV